MNPSSSLPTIDTTWHPLIHGRPPAWASGWGQDRHGIFVEFTLENVMQRLRWIFPGTFEMGSPPDESGRWENEGPRHRVVLPRGYWLFDTPCTQALWQAVTGENPSHFQTPDRPVDSVNWNQVNEFIAKINDRIPGLDLVLPTEAQWEYACRAGTETATYQGALEILGTNNAPVLDSIAWYGGNSGVAFALDNGFDSSDWPERQYPDHHRVGTHPTRGKEPTPQGLYDMLGNVWEWCRDGQREYSEETIVDPIGQIKAGVKRAVRGGSWNSSARSTRAAVRRWGKPDIYMPTLGFRCARA
uniref:Formylglycine-generating enzyme, required for sulfatase activity, contains SUMF1/FGE domain n=1 Tax=Candidatus Kentrum sp. UNK TaxID=2126344 RepID=A0A451A6K9_9GAMM|nr:MAG: Formylglycine-generating enzyme, required for sulfatase activity, contains SUMF1/FGE domain [Candidatus Kentron sp. UNK]VFK68896.1 MAG: Formylglycine-generating enzyme, required for sulfatase activity, contains SUMF1/FGE domain [Candidatus Kentron sp. UNK]